MVTKPPVSVVKNLPVNFPSIPGLNLEFSHPTLNQFYTSPFRFQSQSAFRDEGGCLADISHRLLLYPIKNPVDLKIRSY